METRSIIITVPVGYMLESTVNEVLYKFDPWAMPAAALLHVLEYGAQRIVNDKCGGNDKTPEKKAEIARASITRLTTAPYVRRAVRGASVEPIVRFIRDVLRGIMSDSRFADRAKEYKALKEAEAREEYLDAWFESLDPAFKSRVESAAARALAKSEADKAERAALVADTIGDVKLESPTTESVLLGPDKKSKKPAKK